MRTFKVFNIWWDTSSGTGSYRKAPTAESLGLPDSVTIQVDCDPYADNVDDVICGYLSNVFDYCVFGCEYEYVPIPERS